MPQILHSAQKYFNFVKSHYFSTKHQEVCAAGCQFLRPFLRDCAGVLTSVLGCVLCDFTQFLWFQCCWGGMLVFIGWLGGLWMYSGSNEISTVWVLWEYSGSTVSVPWEYCASTVPVLWEYCSSTVPVLCQ